MEHAGSVSHEVDGRSGPLPQALCLSLKPQPAQHAAQTRIPHRRGRLLLFALELPRVPLEAASAASPASPASSASSASPATPVSAVPTLALPAEA